MSEGDETILDQAKAGIGGVAVPEAVRTAAFDHLTRWWTGEPFAAYRPAIRSLVAAGRFDELVDAFRQVLPFGTGGRRGSVGVGPNRINPWTVATSVQGHVNWLRTTGRAAPSVVVAYDVRRFVDAKGIYGADLGDSPIRNLSSRDLAELAARVYAANGVTVHLLARGAAGWVSTPELSFTIRELGADGGINVSASHNPPDDNGVKVYDAAGGQLAPPDDEALLDVVATVTDATVIGWDEAVASGSLRWLDPDVHLRYVHTAASAAPAGSRAIGVLYTPLHGTGVVHEALAAARFACTLHAPQASPDGAFPTVPGHTANPELPEVMAHAIAAAGPEIDLVIGTDPDADRLGIEVRHQGGWVHLSGNEIAALACLAALSEAPTDPRRPLVVITEVTSSLVSRVARASGAVVVDDLLVGFKYIAAGLLALERDGGWHGLDASDVRFVAGAEESNGVLVTDRIRDKDAAGGAVLLVGLAAGEKARTGRTLVDLLDALRAEHGEIRNTQVSVAYPGATGQDRLATLLDGLRTTPPTEIGGRAVVSWTDLQDETGRMGRFVSRSDRAARNVLVAKLAAGDPEIDEGARVILRPSGTEPKLKVYVEVLGRPRLDAPARRRVDDATAALATAVRAWLA